jgi:hypothetical protein
LFSDVLILIMPLLLSQNLLGLDKRVRLFSLISINETCEPNSKKAFDIMHKDKITLKAAWAKAKGGAAPAKSTSFC